MRDQIWPAITPAGCYRSLKRAMEVSRLSLKNVRALTGGNVKYVRIAEFLGELCVVSPVRRWHNECGTG
jgi:hypothetical protein